MKLDSCAEEREKLFAFLRELGIRSFECRNLVCLSSSDRTRIFCAEDPVFELALSLYKVGENIYHVGMLLGHIRNNVFIPSLELGWKLAEIGAIPHNSIVVLSSELEREFTFGRTIRLDGKTRFSPEIVAVFNERNEFLGWARFSGSSLTPIIDVGSYIRFRD